MPEWNLRTGKITPWRHPFFTANGLTPVPHAIHCQF